MTGKHLAIVLALALVLGVPFALRPEAVHEPDRGARSVIIVTPHVQQIRYEFSRAFERWHLATYGEPAWIDWRGPLGTSEIVRLLEAQFTAAAKAGRFRVDDSANPVCDPGTIGYDVVLGGGSYDHTRLKNGVRPVIGGVEVRIPMSAPAGFAPERLREWYGENTIGAQTLYDPDQFWLGTALSGFGIVYNRRLVERLGVGPPDSFDDLADPRYADWIVLADPRQSGSIATAFESVLNSRGWDDGWRILRSMCGNSRAYTSSSTRPPIDIGQGEAAAGLAIDFYGRNQAQAVGADRVGYVDPPGEVYIDADPVSILRGGPNPETARRFVEFCLTEDAQALWQFPPTGPSARDPGAGTPALGPERYALHRLPVRRVMYERYFDRFVDRVNPFLLAATNPSRGWRSGLLTMMGAFAIDTADEQRAAWIALSRARARDGPRAVRVMEMERLYFSWPDVTMPDGSRLAFSEQNLKAITDAWRKDRAFANRSRIEVTAFFRDQYRRVLTLSHVPPNAK